MKRRFEFRLERVRRVRDLEERVARAERSQAEFRLRAAEAERERAREALEHAREHLRALLSQAPDARLVLALSPALDLAQGELRRASEAAHARAVQAERLSALHREKKSAAQALEELRERARLRHAQALEGHENAVLDEIAQRSHRAEAERRASGGEGASSPAPSAADQAPQAASSRSHGRAP